MTSNTYYFACVSRAELLCSTGFSNFQALSPVLTSDTSISINISIRSLCTSEDSRDISISFFLMLMLMFSEDIVDISISAR